MRVGRAGHPSAYRDAVVKASQEGILTTRELCEAHGISTGTLAKWRKAAGLRLRGVPPGCHPERPVYAKGQCRKCYNKAWEANRR